MGKVMQDEELEMSNEERKEIIRAYEDDILGGLMAAANYVNDKNEVKEFPIVRNGAIVLSVHFRPVSEVENTKCKKDNSTYKKMKGTGAKVLTETDNSRYRSQLIYTATTDEDREKIWDNKEMWKKVNVLNGIDLIDVVMKAGEKDRAIELISEISGFGEDPEETAKN